MCHTTVRFQSDEKPSMAAADPASASRLQGRRTSEAAAFSPRSDGAAWMNGLVLTTPAAPCIHPPPSLAATRMGIAAKLCSLRSHIKKLQTLSSVTMHVRRASPHEVYSLIKKVR